MVIQNFYSSQPIPPAVQASYAALDLAQQQYQLVIENKERCNILITRCEKLLIAVCNQIERKGLQDSTSSNIHTLEKFATLTDLM